MKKKFKVLRVYYYEPCERCGYETAWAVQPEHENKVCWKCGGRVYIDYQKSQELKDEEKKQG